MFPGDLFSGRHRSFVKAWPAVPLPHRPSISGGICDLPVNIACAKDPLVWSNGCEEALLLFYPSHYIVVHQGCDQCVPINRRHL